MAGQSFSGRTAISLSYCRFDRKRKFEKSSTDRRQKTEDRGLGCMSFRMLQPSSFVFCPLSSVLPRNQKPRNQKPRNLETSKHSCSFLAASGGNLLDTVQGKQAMPCLTRKVVSAAERTLIREQIPVLTALKVYSPFSCSIETGEAAFARACAIDVVSIRIPCPQGETSLDRVQVPVF